MRPEPSPDGVQPAVVQVKHPVGERLHARVVRDDQYRRPAVVGAGAQELDHLRYVCMVDDSRARSELGFLPRYGIEDTLRAVYSER